MVLRLEVPDYAPNLQIWGWLVKARDNYTCQDCKRKLDIKNLEAHHLDKDPTKVLLVQNGITVCRECHHHNRHNNGNNGLKTWFSIPQLADKLGISGNTLTELVEARVIRASKNPVSNEWRISKQALIDFLSSPTTNHYTR